MIKKYLINKIFLFFFLLLGIFFYFNYKKQEQISKISDFENLKEKVHSANKIKNIKHTSIDNNKNEYTIEAEEGEIDLDNSSIIFLKNVKANIRLIESEDVFITSNFGKYNINTHDSIFSKNIIIDYANNRITGEYLDLSLINNLMIISKNVVYTKDSTLLKADVVEMKLDSKNIKVFMHENKNKVNIITK